MTREQLLALPRADQSRKLMEWDKVMLVPTGETYEDSEYRIFAVVGMVHRHGVTEPTHIITEGDLINWDSKDIMPSIDMLSSYDNCTAFHHFGYRLLVYGGGGTIFMKFVAPSTSRIL